VERANRTLQDRLVKELRLAGISSMEAGNAFLPGFIESFNARFAITPTCPTDLHRRLNVSTNRLRDILCHRVMRHVGAQLTLSYDRKLITLIRNEMTEGIAEKYVEIYHYADGRVDVRWKGVSLSYAVFDKEQRISQATVVENKRLGAALVAEVIDHDRYLVTDGVRCSGYELAIPTATSHACALRHRRVDRFEVHRISERRFQAN
jgi:hypothetical protein